MNTMTYIAEELIKELGQVEKAVGDMRGLLRMAVKEMEKQNGIESFSDHELKKVISAALDFINAAEAEESRRIKAKHERMLEACEGVR